VFMRGLRRIICLGPLREGRMRCWIWEGRLHRSFQAYFRCWWFGHDYIVRMMRPSRLRVSTFRRLPGRHPLVSVLVSFGMSFASFVVRMRDGDDKGKGKTHLLGDGELARTSITRPFVVPRLG
jgi:hypothetical protein